jgi:hypothetical protein
VAEQGGLSGRVASDWDDGPRGFDTSVAHPARVWDYLLEGKDNFAADREAAEKVLQVMPIMGLVARAGRAFLAEAVHHLAAGPGIRQFLDIGTGLPTANNTHEVAQRVTPQARVVYVDNDRCKSGCAHATPWLPPPLSPVTIRNQRGNRRTSRAIDPPGPPMVGPAGQSAARSLGLSGSRYAAWRTRPIMFLSASARAANQSSPAG